jgi:hypothetical protein
MISSLKICKLTSTTFLLGGKWLYLEIYFLSALVHVAEIIVHCLVVPVSVNILENHYLLPSMVPAPLEQNSVRFRDKYYFSKVW